MSPTETPHGTWETRLNASKSFNGSNSQCNRCPNCDPDLDYIALLKKEIGDLRKSKAQYTAEVHVSDIYWLLYLQTIAFIGCRNLEGLIVQM